MAAAEGETQAGTVWHSCPDLGLGSWWEGLLAGNRGYPGVSEERYQEAAGFQSESLELPGMALWQHLL